MRSYDTLSEAINDLTKRGYKTNFNIKNDCLACEDLMLHPEDYNVDEFYRFEGPTDPSDENILFAISSEKYKMKGLLVNAFGMYGDSFSAKLISKLNKHQ